MGLPASWLSAACCHVVEFVKGKLTNGDNPVRFRLGSPADAAPAEGDTDHCLNFFFYQVEPGGFGPGPASDENWWVRIQCLVTAFGAKDGETSAGENDLRLLGEAIRLFHETPVLDPLTVEGTTFELQVVFQPLPLDALNHLWSTQNGTAYRPSVAYELAVAPVVPSVKAGEAPQVQAIGLQVKPSVDRRDEPQAGSFTGPFYEFPKVAP